MHFPFYVRRYYLYGNMCYYVVRMMESEISIVKTTKQKIQLQNELLSPENSGY